MVLSRPPALVLCLGEALIDRLGPPGGDPALDHAVDDRLGGAPANVACGLARLGTPAAFLGRLGDDVIGSSFQQLFNQRGVNQLGVQRDGERPSRVVLVRRDAHGERMFQGFAGDRGKGFADQALDEDALTSIWPQVGRRAQWLLIGTIPLASPAAADALWAAVRLAAVQRVKVAVDVNWRPTFWNPQADPAGGPPPAALTAIHPLLQQAALIKLAREEALWFFATDDPAVIADSLPQRPAVVVTNGSAPVRCCIGDEFLEMPTVEPERVVDTTGAGDAFTAGLLHHWDASVSSRLRFAAACGALVCGGPGAIDPQPTQAQVLHFLGDIS